MIVLCSYLFAVNAMGKRAHKRSQQSLKKRRYTRKKIKKEKIRKIIETQKQLPNSSSDVHVENGPIYNDCDTDKEGRPIGELDKDTEKPLPEFDSDTCTSQSGQDSNTETELDTCSSLCKSRHKKGNSSTSNVHVTSVLANKLQDIPDYSKYKELSFSEDPLEVGFLLWKKHASYKSRLESMFDYSNW